MRWIERTASLAGGASLVVLVAITAAGVFARYVMGHPLAWTEEAAGLLMVWIVMISAVATEARGEHLTVDVIDHYLPPSARRALAAVVAVMSIGLLAMLAWQGWSLAETSGMRRTNILRVSWFWVYVPVTLGAVGLIAVTVMKALGHASLPVSSVHEADQ